MCQQHALFAPLSIITVPPPAVVVVHESKIEMTTHHIAKTLATPKTPANTQIAMFLGLRLPAPFVGFAHAVGLTIFSAPPVT